MCSHGWTARLAQCVYEMATFCRDYKEFNALDRLKDDLLLLSLEWPGSLSLARLCFSTDLTDEELDPLVNFKCRNARCFKPMDRAVVLAAIRRDWGSETAFDKFVREVLPGVLRESKKRYSTQLSRLAGRSFNLAFGG